MAGASEVPALHPTTQSPRRGHPGLRRALGKWDLTAIGVNQVIGSAIFLLPSQVAAEVGPWGPLAFAAIGVLSISIALCFAEADEPPECGARRQVRSAGRFETATGFGVGWMMWFSR